MPIAQVRTPLLRNLARPLRHDLYPEAVLGIGVAANQ
jgi:hypothetical protein